LPFLVEKNWCFEKGMAEKKKDKIDGGGKRGRDRGYKE
jgi:hypothetical protein